MDQLTGNLGDAAASGGGHLDLDGTYTNDRQLTIDASTLTLRGDWTNADTLVASGATINLDGSFTLADVGTLQRTGGSVQLVGTLDNTATTLTLNSASGSWTMQGGTVIGGTIVTTPEASLLVTSNGNNRLDGVTVEGDLTLAANGALLRIANGLTLDGTIHMDGNGATLGFEGSQTLSGSGTIQFGTSGSGNRYLEMASDGTLTIDAGITLRGGKANVGGSSRWGRSMSLINQGAILADVPGQTLRIQASRGSFVNQGLLRAAGGTLNVDQLTGNLGDAAASGGGHLDLDGTYTNDRQLTIDASTLTLRGDWTNADTLVASGATINLDGSFTLADVGTLQRTGGSVQLVGTLDNTATTLTLNTQAAPGQCKEAPLLGAPSSPRPRRHCWSPQTATTDWMV